MKTNLLLAGFISLAATLAPAAPFTDDNWLSMHALSGEDVVDLDAMVVDGLGNLYIVGYFTNIGGVSGNFFAKWDGSSWSALGTGINSEVDALAASGSNIYAGGYFTNASGIPGSFIAKWDGTAWSALGSGMNNPVYALAVSGTNLYAGGQFTSAGGNAANHIAKWNGSNWSPLGAGMDGSVMVLAVSGTNLYAGGAFTNAGGITVNQVAKWDGNAWSALGAGMRGDPPSPCVYALAVSGTNLYAGGEFTTAGGSAANYIAKWDGNAWSPLGTGMRGHSYSYVVALAVRGTDLYAGGAFTNAGGTAANYIAKWNGSEWSALGSGVADNGPNDDPLVYALAVSGTDLYVGGEFRTAGGKPSQCLAKALLNGPPINLTGTAKLPNGSIQFGFTHNPSNSFSALATTNAALPASNWTTLGPVTEISPGRYQFTDADATNFLRRFYRVLWP